MGSLNVGPVVGRFREVLQYIHKNTSHICEELFSKNALSAIPENELPMFKDWDLVKKFAHMYISIHICTHLWRALFQNMISELRTGIATSIFESAFNAVFWKRALRVSLSSKTSLNRPTTGPTLSTQLRKMVGLGN